MDAQWPKYGDFTVKVDGSVMTIYFPGFQTHMVGDFEDPESTATGNFDITIDDLTTNI